MESEDANTSPSHRGDEDALVRQELETVLQHALFAKSKRYPKFLRFIVEKSLANDVASLKERVIGIELLGKPGDYDNAVDPEVRNIASEVRKRLVRYYECTPEPQVRIDLPAGSYIPVFHKRAHAEATVAELLQSPNVTTVAEESNSSNPPGRLLNRYRGMVAAVLVLLLMGAAFATWSWHRRHRTARPTVLESFWQPMFHSGAPVSLVIGTRGTRMNDAGSGSQPQPPISVGPPTVSMDSASALSRITVFLGSHGEGYEIHAAQETHYADLRQRPAVLIGGLNNAWVLRLLEHSRYRLAYDDTSKRIKIVDSTSARSWLGPQFGINQPDEHLDYAIVARQKDPTTGGFVIIVAGLGSAGTLAAAEFVTDATFLQQINSPSMDQNLEFVIATNVIDTVPGPPRVVATHSWH